MTAATSTMASTNNINKATVKGDGDDLIAATRQSLLALNAQRTALEQEASTIEEELLDGSQGHAPMGIDTPLVDSDGYPRADIDVYKARSLRGRLAEIRTDHKALLKEIERHLTQLAALEHPSKVEQERAELAARRQGKPKPKFDPVSGKWVVQNWDGTVAGAPNGEHRRFDRLEEDTTTPSSTTGGGAVSSSATTLQETPSADSNSGNAVLSGRPFARIDSLGGADAPAARAGLRVNDLLVSVGSVHADTAHPMHALGGLIPEVAGAQESITVVILRQREQSTGQGEDMEYKSLELRPAPWQGRGLLGCHIVPYSSSSA